MKVELSNNAVVEIVGQSLCDTLSYLTEAINHRMVGNGIPYYDDDPEADVKYIQEKINAVREVLDLYGLENAKT